jgi:hypothetical protein
VDVCRSRCKERSMRFRFTGRQADSDHFIQGEVSAASLKEAADACRARGVEVIGELLEVPDTPELKIIVDPGPPSKHVGQVTMMAGIGTTLIAVFALAAMALLNGASDQGPRQPPDEKESELARRKSKPSVAGDATRRAWSDVHRTDLKALSRITSSKVEDQVAGLRIIVDGYSFDRSNVDPSLLEFRDRHVALAEAVLTENKRWDQARSEGLREMERNGELVDALVGGIFPEEFARGAKAGRRLGTHADQKAILEEIDSRYGPTYTEAFQKWLQSLKSQESLSKSLSSRYAAEFPVAIVAK